MAARIKKLTITDKIFFANTDSSFRDLYYNIFRKEIIYSRIPTCLSTELSTMNLNIS